MIEGVKIKKLRIIPDERGRVMEILREDDDMFIKFGQVYMTTVYPGVVKGWHYHKKQTDSLCAIKGMAKLVIYDARKDSISHGQISELVIGEYNPIIVQIPPFVYQGFKGLGKEETIIINTPTEVYNQNEPDEFRIDPYTNEIPYDWKLKER